MKGEMIAWLRTVRLWADMVRVLPNTLTLIRDEMGDAAAERLGTFLGYPLYKGFYQPNGTERPPVPDHFPSLKAHSRELTEIFSMVRDLSHAHQPLWKCDGHFTIANDPGIDPETRAMMRGYKDGPISESSRYAD